MADYIECGRRSDTGPRACSPQAGGCWSVVIVHGGAVGGDEALADGVEDGLGAVADVDLPVDAQDVVVHRPLADPEAAGDLPVGRSGGEHATYMTRTLPQMYGL